MESSRTHFEVLGLGLEGQVLGLGLEASSPRKLPCPWLEDSTIFWIVKILWRSLEKFLWRLFFFGEHLCLCSWSLALAFSISVLGLESVCPRKSCPWPWPRIFFVSLALASSFVSSTPPLIIIHSKIFLREFCFVMKISSYRSTRSVREPRPPQLKFNDFFQSAFSMANFFKSILWVKTGEFGGELLNCYWKMVK